MKILIVCTGNTCRSPMAEGILKSMLDACDNIEVISGGIFASDGDKVSKNAVLALEEMGLDIADHAAHSINNEVVADADLVLTMTKNHKQTLAAIFGSEILKKTYTLCEYAGTDADIADPFGGDIDIYRQCAKTLCVVIEEVYKKVRSGSI